MKNDFIKFAKSALSKYPKLNHSLEIEGDACKLEFPVSSEEGFGITVEFDDLGGIVLTDRAIHFHFDFQKGFRDDVGYNDAFDSTFESIMELILDFLTPRMRIRELTAGRRGEFEGAYKWELEGETDGEWYYLDSMMLVFWNYFGKRDQNLLQNKILPIRNNIRLFGRTKDQSIEH